MGNSKSKKARGGGPGGLGDGGGEAGRQLKPSRAQKRSEQRTREQRMAEYSAKLERRDSTPQAFAADMASLLNGSEGGELAALGASRFGHAVTEEQFDLLRHEWRLARRQWKYEALVARNLTMLLRRHVSYMSLTARIAPLVASYLEVPEVRSAARRGSVLRASGRIQNAVLHARLSALLGIEHAAQGGRADGTGEGQGLSLGALAGSDSSDGEELDSTGPSAQTTSLSSPFSSAANSQLNSARSAATDPARYSLEHSSVFTDDDDEEDESDEYTEETEETTVTASVAYSDEEEEDDDDGDDDDEEEEEEEEEDGDEEEEPEPEPEPEPEEPEERPAPAAAKKKKKTVKAVGKLKTKPAVPSAGKKLKKKKAKVPPVAEEGEAAPKTKKTKKAGGAKLKKSASGALRASSSSESLNSTGAKKKKKKAPTATTTAGDAAPKKKKKTVVKKKKKATSPGPDGVAAAAAPSPSPSETRRKKPKTAAVKKKKKKKTAGDGEEDEDGEAKKKKKKVRARLSRSQTLSADMASQLTAARRRPRSDSVDSSASGTSQTGGGAGSRLRSRRHSTIGRAQSGTLGPGGLTASSSTRSLRSAAHRGAAGRRKSLGGVTPDELERLQHMARQEERERRKKQVIEEQRRRLARVTARRKRREARRRELEELMRALLEMPCIYTSEVSGNRAVKSHTRSIRWLFESHKITYRVVDVSLDHEEKEYMQKSSGITDLPQVFVTDRYRGGWDEIQTANEQERLADLLAPDPPEGAVSPLGPAAAAHAAAAEPAGGGAHHGRRPSYMQPTESSRLRAAPEPEPEPAPDAAAAGAASPAAEPTAEAFASAGVYVVGASPAPAGGKA